MTEIYIRDRSSGRIHRATRIEGITELQTFETDNLDSSGERDEISADELTDAEAVDLCQRCFPDHVTVSNSTEEPE